MIEYLFMRIDVWYSTTEKTAAVPMDGYFVLFPPRESLTLFIRGGIVVGMLINTSKTARDNLR